MTTEALTKAITLQAAVTANSVKVQAALESLSKLDAFLEQTFPTASLTYTSGYAGTPGLHITIPVKDLPVEMAQHLAAWESFGVPLDAWTTCDDPAQRRRSFWANPTEAAPCDVFFNAVLANDSTCRIEVVGMQESEVWEQTLVKRSTPIMHLVCPDPEAP